MPNYRRLWQPGGTYFFTVNLQQRQGNDLLVSQIANLRHAIRSVRNKHPFHIHAWVVLPDHMHCIIELPDGDPVKHGLVFRVIDWPFSTFHRWVAAGVYPADWAGQ